MHEYSAACKKIVLVIFRRGIWQRKLLWWKLVVYRVWAFENWTDREMNFIPKYIYKCAQGRVWDRLILLCMARAFNKWGISRRTLIIRSCLRIINGSPWEKGRASVRECVLFYVTYTVCVCFSNSTPLYVIQRATFREICLALRRAVSGNIFRFLFSVVICIFFSIRI